MSALNYVGAPPSAANDLCSVAQATEIFGTATMNHAMVNEQVQTAALACASQIALTTEMAPLPASPDYYATQDALNVPLAWGGAKTTKTVTGVATLDSAGHLEVAQLPPLGGGCIAGPYAVAKSSQATTSSAPVKIISWDLGTVDPHMLPWAYLTVAVLTKTVFAQPVVEIRMSATDDTYQNQTLISRGVGSGFFNGQQVISVLPAPSTTGQTYNHTGLPWPTLYLNAWLYDMNGQQVSSGGSNAIAGSGVYLVRDAVS